MPWGGIRPSFRQLDCALRREWRLGAILLAATVTKLFLVDLADTGGPTRIVSYLMVGALTLVVGYVSALPPPEGTDSKHN